MFVSDDEGTMKRRSRRSLWEKKLGFCHFVLQIQRSTERPLIKITYWTRRRRRSSVTDAIRGHGRGKKTQNRRTFGHTWDPMGSRCVVKTNSRCVSLLPLLYVSIEDATLQSSANKNANGKRFHVWMFRADAFFIPQPVSLTSFGLKSARGIQI